MRPRIWLTATVVASLLAVAGAGSASAGGQGENLPPPPFRLARDDRPLAQHLRTARLGAPAPRLVRIDDPSALCLEPEPLRTEVQPEVYCGDGIGDPLFSSEPVPGCQCTPEGLDFWVCVPLEAGYEFPLHEREDPLRRCRPDFLSGASLEARVRVEHETSEDADVTDEWTCGEDTCCEDGETVLRRSSTLLTTLEVDATTSGSPSWQEVGKWRVPPELEPKAFDFVRRFNDLGQEFLSFCSEPVLVDEIGWFDGEPANAFDCSGPLVLAPERLAYIEKAAFGLSFQGGLPRAELIAAAQDALPDILCRPNASGRCTYTPALTLVDDDGQLSNPDDASCGFTIRFSEPVTSCNDGIDNDDNGLVDFPDDPSCPSPRTSGETRFAEPSALSNLPTPPLIGLGSSLVLATSSGGLPFLVADEIGDIDCNATGELVVYPIAAAGPALRTRAPLYATGCNFAGNTLNGAIAADLDRDGDTDLVASVFDDFDAEWRLTWFENDPDVPEGWQTHSFGLAGTSSVKHLADLDGDGDPDLVATRGDWWEEEWIWFENAIDEGHGWIERSFEAAIDEVRHVADFDGDGDLDLVAAAGSQCVLLRNGLADATSNDWDLDVISTEGSCGDWSHVDESGGPEAARRLLILQSGTILSYEHRNGDWIESSSPYPSSASPLPLDADGDGTLDLLVEFPLGVGWLVSTRHDDATTTWEPKEFFVAGRSTEAAVLGDVIDVDIDGDGAVDLIFASSEGIRYLRNPGSLEGTWRGFPIWKPRGETDPLNGLGQVSKILTADVDGDGDIDLLTWYPGVGPVLIESLMRASNNLRENAHPLDGLRTHGTLVGATGTEPISCLADDTPSVWFYFTAPSAATVQIDTCGTHDRGEVDAGVSTVLALFSDSGEELACNPDWTGAPVSVGCGSVDAGGPGDAALVRSVEAGERLFVRVSRSADSFDGPFQLNVQFIPEAEPALAGLAAAFALGVLARRRRGGRAAVAGPSGRGDPSRSPIARRAADK